MYEFSPVSERIASFRQQVRDRVIQSDAERAVLFTEAFKANEGMAPVLKIPLATLHTCKNVTVRVEDFDIIVGSKSKYFPGSGATPTWADGFWYVDKVESGQWQLRDDGLYHNDEVATGFGLTIAPEDVQALQEIRQYWDSHMIRYEADSTLKPEGYEEFAKMQVTMHGEHSLMMIPVGHLTAGFQNIIAQGYGAIRRQAQDWLDAHRGRIAGSDANKYLFYKAVTIICDAAIILTKRYAQACRDKAASATTHKRRAELEQMAKGLDWIATNPARTFWEACQQAIMYLLFLNLDSGLPGTAFGRLDQYTWPFLEKDLAEGRITMQYAQEIVDSVFLRINTFYTVSMPEMDKTAGIGSTYIHTTIGGYTRDGKDGTNPVTYMVLETMGRLKLHDPPISLRLTKDSPDKLWQCAMETSRLVGGLPLLQNDEVIIPGIIKELGFELEDARDYSLIGCQEIVGSGTDYPAPNGVHPPYASIHFGAILTIALNDGKNPLNNEQGEIHSGYLYEMQSMEEVRAAYKQQSKYFFDWLITMANFTEYFTRRQSPHAALSISMEGCMQKGMDATDGGCKYNSFGGTAPGLATVADSLTTIKYMCFDKQICSTRELYDAFMANWEGHEDLRQYIINNVPHFGNGDPYADAEMKFCVETYYELCDSATSIRTKKYKPGLYGASDHIAQGYVTFATPNGRRTGEPLADAASPCQGRDSQGPTGIFNSAVCYDHSRCMGGMALNVKMHPRSLESEDGVSKLANLTKTYFEMGGMEVQYNVVDAQTMRAAQENPDEYRNLVVRIAGFSAYFVEMGPDLQNDLISRTENAI